MEKSELIEKGILAVVEDQLQQAYKTLQDEDHFTPRMAEHYKISSELVKMFRVSACQHTVTQIANLLDYENRHGFSKEASSRIREIDDLLWEEVGKLQSK